MVLLAAALALTGCGGADDKSAGSTADRAAVGAASTGGAGAAQDVEEGAGASGSKAAPAPKPRPVADRIIRTAALTVQVKDVSRALDEARATTENAGGYVGDETTGRDEDGSEHTRVVLRIPVQKYDDVLVALQGAGKLLQRTAKAQDVTDQVVDVESRIASQRASVARVRELMDRATKLGDVVTLEGELSNREADLEALLAQQASLKDRTSLATVTLTLSEKPVVRDAEDDAPGFVDALAGGWTAFVTTLRWIAVVFGAVLPFLAAAALLLLAWLRVTRPRRRAAPVEASEEAGRPGQDRTGSAP
ncbi:lipoprotein [Streptomyces humidus]|uniref:Lipoprotein n=1 Tax=Streptomyces humidus TaxID=52259 RepID=A0A918FR04_9ACTN|nr:lipoprotein [Streptomyces humidus]